MSGCSKCHRMFQWPFQLEHHMERDHTNIANHDCKLFRELERYECDKDECNFISDYKLGACQHRNILSENWREHRCERCSFATLSALLLASHYEQCTSKLNLQRNGANPNRFLCRKCPFQTKRKLSLKIHLMNHVAAKDVKTWFDCTECSYRTIDKSNLIKHRLVHVPFDQIRWFSCIECSYRAKRQKDLMRHNSMVHVDPSEVKWFNCTQCPHRTKWKYALTAHLREHDKTTQKAPRLLIDPRHWHNCSQCAFRTLRKDQLLKHVANHDRLFKCSTCGFTTKDRHYLKRHCLIRHTTKAYRFSCTRCAFKTVYKGSMKNHLLRHRSDDEVRKWFYCAHCSYKARFKVLLVSHLKSHEGKSKVLWLREEMDAASWLRKRLEFGCKKCWYRTKFRVYLKAHMQRHEREPWRVCAKCSYRTKNEKVIRWHRIRHVSNVNMARQVKKAKQELVLNQNMVKHVASILRNVLHLTKQEV